MKFKRLCISIMQVYKDIIKTKIKSKNQGNYDYNNSHTFIVIFHPFKLSHTSEVTN
jgi:hypothetical protein